VKRNSGWYLVISLAALATAALPAPTAWAQEGPSRVLGGPRSAPAGPGGDTIYIERHDGRARSDGAARIERQVPSARRFQDSDIRLNDLRDADARRLRPYRRFYRDPYLRTDDERFIDHRLDPLRYRYYDHFAYPYPYGFYRYGGEPVIIIDDAVIAGGTDTRGGSVTYQAGERTYSAGGEDGRRWVEGHWAEMPREDLIEGETVEVFHPAVYRQREDGSLEELEEERVTREPKYRVVLTPVWIEGHYVDERGIPLEPVRVEEAPTEEP